MRFSFRAPLRWAALVLGLAALAVVIAPAPAVAIGGCSRATATRLVKADGLNVFLLPHPVGQVLCGPFAGAGSHGMLVTVGASTCWAIQQWAVFTNRGGRWELVHDQSVFIYPPVKASGGAFTVTSPAFRARDPRCVPSGGRITRTWRWNGRRFSVVATRRTPRG